MRKVLKIKHNENKKQNQNEETNQLERVCIQLRLRKFKYDDSSEKISPEY